MRSIVKTAKSAIYKLLKSKISITIVLPEVVGVNHSIEPKVDTQESPFIQRSYRTNYRFIEEKRYAVDGSKTDIYFTEEYKNGSWKVVFDTISVDKNVAIDRHLKLMEHGTLKPTIARTILWEGLDKEETKSWAILHSS